MLGRFAEQLRAASMAVRLWAGLVAALAGLWSGDAWAQERVALVIGNGKYVNASVLPNPANDARAVGNSLRNIGFDVVQGTDLDRNGMERLLREFLRKAAVSKVALFFYAGHGMQVDGRNYLIPVDAQLESASDLNFGTVELDKVLAGLEDPARASIIILDACRDNPLARSFASRLGTTRSAAVGAGLAGYSALGNGTLIAFATAPGQVALDGNGSNSPFSQALVKHLATPGIEVRQMLTRVRSEVATATANKQVPWDNSSLRGDIYLTGLPPGAPAGSLPAITVAPVAPPITSTPVATEASLAWAATKDTTSAAVLRAFIARYGDTFYANLARARLEELSAAPPVPATPVVPSLTVLTATYGGNCGAPEGNMTSVLAQACNGKDMCAYTIDYQVIGDPKFGCGKNYTARWRCAGKPGTRTAHVDPEAGFRKIISLSCL